MKNKLLIITIFSLSLIGCSKLKHIEDPLILPPKFNEIPSKDNSEGASTKAADPTIDNLKDLLLKKQ